MLPRVIAQHPGHDAVGASVLEYSHPQCFDNGSQARYEPGQMYTRQVGGECGAARERARQPAAVSSRSAVPNTLRFNTQNVSVWLDVLKKMSGPESGITAVNDCALRGGISFKRWVSGASRHTIPT